ncbi:MAG: elongation factor P hydroxylase [bacterium]
MTDKEIVAVFTQCFWRSHATVLVGGAAEPLYQPAIGHEPHRLFYREDYAASALHEVAHWCVAGAARRKQVDYGYTYSPPPRTEAAQMAFFAAELKVQSLEQIFCAAAGLTFVPSADQLGVDLTKFRQQLTDQKPRMRHWMRNSQDQRARQFRRGLRLARQQGCSGPVQQSDRHTPRRPAVG